MTESMITLRGYLGADPEIRFVGTRQVPVAHFRMACTPRRFNPTTSEWSDAPTQWYSVSAWRQLGSNCQQSLHKGDAVFVNGRLTSRSYVNKDGFEVNTFEVEASVVGHDLNRGASNFARNLRPVQQPRPIQEEPGVRQPDRSEQADRYAGWHGSGQQERQDPAAAWSLPGSTGSSDPWEQELGAASVPSDDVAPAPTEREETASDAA